MYSQTSAQMAEATLPWLKSALLFYFHTFLVE